MPRAMWSGAISFGLVNIPIKLFTAVSRKNVSFNQIDTRTGSRIQYRKVSAADGDEVPNEAIAKGYQLSSGEYVLVGDDELAALDPVLLELLAACRSLTESPDTKSLEATLSAELKPR